MLSKADTGLKDKQIEWCEYVLRGLKEEIEKIDQLLDLQFLFNTILLPALRFALEQKHITEEEFRVLNTLIRKPNMVIKSDDVKHATGIESPVRRSRIIHKLKEKRMLLPISEGAYRYTIGFRNNYLLRGVIGAMTSSGLIPSSLEQKL